ncbi:MAG TPA: PAS domain S-box protein, partial [Longimicrobiaceae bacterium]|nr:PAS domain S-box protein [Longimicrobiaceae bacterium]
MDTRTAESGLAMGELMARALRDSEARLRSVINSAPLVLWTLDREGTFTSSEGKGLEILGLRPGEVVGRSVFEVYRGNPQLLEDIQRALAGEEVTTEVEVGAAVFEARYSALRDEEGELAGTIGVAVDVTERRHAEEELRRSEERTREILESAHDAFITMDTQGRVCGWNSQAEATFGWPREEALGKPLVELIIPPHYREAHQQGLARFLATGDGPVLGRRIEVTALHRDGNELPIEMTISAIRQGESYLFSAFLHDITERKRAEAALQR